MASLGQALEANSEPWTSLLSQQRALDRLMKLTANLGQPREANSEPWAGS